MARKPNTNKDGGAWTEAQKKAVWAKGNTITGFSPDIHRSDKCNKYINYNQHGNRESDYGWEIDHIKPVAHGGTDDLDNLQPLHWKNNLSKGDSLTWKCP